MGASRVARQRILIGEAEWMTLSGGVYAADSMLSPLGKSLNHNARTKQNL